jgi:hypothetical protein
VDNLESRHQIIKALELVECPCVDDQRIAANCEALPHAHAVARLEHFRPHTGVDRNHAFWLDALIQNEGAQFLGIGDDYVSHSRNHIVEGLGQSGGERARAKKIIRRKLIDHRVDCIVNYRHSGEPTNDAADEHSLVVMGMDQVNLMCAHNLKEFDQKQGIKNQALVTGPDIHLAIRANVSHSVDLDTGHWNFMAERVGNNANRMSAPGKFLRHFLDRRRGAVVRWKRAGGNHGNRIRGHS